MTSKTPHTSRRTILKTAAAGAALGTLGAPAILRAQAAPIKIGVLHPVTGPLSYSGTQSRAGALMAIEELNAAGGIKSLGGAKLEIIYADAGDSTEKIAVSRIRTIRARSRNRMAVTQPLLCPRSQP